ncbi:2856_t:CDS:2, partial [Acaulospora morrowiae]
KAAGAVRILSKMLLVFIIVYVVMTIILIVNQIQSKETAITRCTNLNSTMAASCQEVETWKIIRNAILAAILIVFEVFYAGTASRYATELENMFRLKRRRVPTSTLSAANLTTKEYFDPHGHQRPV